ncbi:hypothetical protein AVEN_59039-1, partial [Araneus ventricosus]
IVMDDFIPHEPVSIGHNSEYFILQGFDFLAISFSRQTPNLGRIGQNRSQKNLFKKKKGLLGKSSPGYSGRHLLSQEPCISFQQCQKSEAWG